MSNALKPLPDVTRDPRIPLEVWQRCRENPVRAAKVAAVKANLAAGVYDRHGPHIGIAVENLMMDLHDIGEATGGMPPAEQEARDETPVREFDGCD